MLGLPRVTSRALTSWRRSAAAALIALQAVIAVAPMLERRGEVRRATHVAAQGRRHLFGHDEGTCTLCAARTLVRDVPANPAGFVAVTAPGTIDVAYAVVVPAADAAPDSHSRAPPVLG